MPRRQRMLMRCPFFLDAFNNSFNKSVETMVLPYGYTKEHSMIHWMDTRLPMSRDWNSSDSLPTPPPTQQRSKQLQAFNLTKDADYSATLLSRRLFCYQSPQQPRRLLDSIRLRPNAPLRKIPVHQAVAVYDSATTYVTFGDSLLLHTEWPNTKCTWGIATTTTMENNNKKKKKNHSDSSFDFNVFVKPNSPRVPNLSTLSSSTSSSKDVVVAPKRSQLIQFGTTSSQQQQAAANHQGKFGVRETYSYSTDSSPNTLQSRPRDWLDRLLRTTPPEQVSVKYTRYGEGPPWYGAGKYCMLELQGRRVASVQEAPPLAASIAAERVPGFLSVHAPILSDASAQRAMEWFRQGHLQLSDEHVEQQARESAQWNDWGDWHFT